MQTGMTLPVMEPDLNRALLREWCEAIDRGPWSALAFGERIVFDNPDAAVMLGAAAAWTERVDLVVTIFVAALHNPVMLAKQIATADMLCDGRLRAGFGTGGRDEDYAAAGSSDVPHTNDEMGKRVATMLRVWQGEHMVEGVERRVGPPCVQNGRPRLLAGAMGPKAIAKAAKWADGVCGMSFGPDPDEIRNTFAIVREAWDKEGKPAPQLGTSFWYALEEDGGRAQLDTHLKRYFTWVDTATRDAIAASAGFVGTAQELRDMLRRIEDAGADEVLLIPTASGIDQVHRIADVLG